ncbi:MAG: ornithine carbamoyltransferase [Acidobacteriota bacterium]|nr:ornithine carbamoyltransferase [Acidobacteriota bacterium]
MPEHLISIADLKEGQIESILELALELQARPEAHGSTLHGKSIGLYFEKSSTRTRVSFEVGMGQLGGQAIFLTTRDLQIGRGETIADTARVLSRYVDLLMLRTFEHRTVVEMARHATVPVINGLTDELHPCQALADLMTVHQEFGELRGRRIAYIGDGNNVAHSLMIACARAGVDFSLASPPGYKVADRYLELARSLAAGTGAGIETGSDPQAAAAGADAVYSDVWTSMGQEKERKQRLAAFEGYTVDDDLMARAKGDAIYLHCLPCHRGEEVTASVVDGPQSRVFDQAENRMHTQKAVMLRFLDHA